MQEVYSVSQINRYIRNMFDNDYVLGSIYMKGEVSNCKYHSSGHIYFTLKDEASQMSCIMFAGSRIGLNFRLEEGMSIIVKGSIKVYERDGKYQMYVNSIKRDGIGMLYERYEALKTKLEGMGYFDEVHKKPIPVFAKKIGIVTASTGAAIKDIMQISARRNPYVQLILYPAKVQGEGAGLSISKGIKTLDRLGVDIIIAGRGGGSIEDLWAFNEEETAKAFYECKTPIISAVGHETDTTITDYVADLRAPTPSAAAELAVYDVSAFLDKLADYHYLLVKGVTDKIGMERSYVEAYKIKLNYLSPLNMLDIKKQQTDEYEDKLKFLFERVLSKKKNEFLLYVQKLKALSPLDKLESGFSYVADKDNKVITSIEQVKSGDDISVELKDGIINAKVLNVKSL